MATKTRERRDYGDGSVFQIKTGRDAGTWVAQVENGYGPTGRRRPIRRYAQSEAKAERKLVKLKRDLKDGTVATGLTVKVWADRWLEKRATSVRPKTYQTDVTAIRQWVVPAIGRRKLASLTRSDIDRVMQAQRDANVKASSMRRYHSALMTMLKDARDYDHQVPDSVLTVKPPALNETDRAAMPLPDAVKLLRIIALDPDPSRWLAVLLQALRPSEVLGTMRDAFDFEQGTMTVSWQLQSLRYREARSPESGFLVPDGHEFRHLEGTWCLVRPKTRSGWRVVPLTPTMADAARMWLETSVPSPHGLMWAREDGGPIAPKRFIEDWRALQRIAGIEHPARKRLVDGKEVADQYVVHEGRHTTATILKLLGVPDEVIVQIMGHSSMLSSKTYIHQDLLEQVRAALATLDGQLQIEGGQSDV